MTTPYLIQQGDTLGQIAANNKTDISTLQGLNPQITDINKIQAGANLNLPEVKTAAPATTGQNQAIVSSDLARNEYDKNVNTVLPKMEGQFAQGTNPEVKQGETLAPNALNIKSANVALQSLIGNLNDAIKQRQGQGIQLTPEEQAQLNEINNLEQQKTLTIANAREAADTKNASKLNESVTKVQEYETLIKAKLDTLKTAQQGMVSALTPTAQEQQLKSKLNTLRTDRQLLPIELRQQGISAEGIRTGQVNDERVRAIQESNLLAEIGLEVDSRKMSLESATQQANFIAQDVELQMKIQDKLDTQERQVIEDASNLRKEALTALSTITDSFSGLAWEDMDAETQTDLVNTAKQFNIPINLIESSLKVAKQQQVFENSLKVKSNTSAVEAGGSVAGTGSGGGVGGMLLSSFTPSEIALAEDRLKGITISDAMLKSAGTNIGRVEQATQALPKYTDPKVAEKLNSAKSIRDFAEAKLTTIADILGTEDAPKSDYAKATGAMRTSPLNIFNQGKTDVILNIEQLVSQETLKTLTELKATGATLGAISEKELSILENAATKIAGARKNNFFGGGIDGYDMSEAAFRKEIERMRTSSQNLIAEMEKRIAENSDVFSEEEQSQLNEAFGGSSDFSPSTYFQ